MTKRLYELDGIRGVAALMIAFHHYPYLVGLYLHGAWMAVDIFFIMSGIVLTHVYERGIQRGETSIAEFCVHRFARLYPLHFLTIIIALAVDLIAYQFLWHGFHRGHLFINTIGFHGKICSPYFSGLLNLLMLQGVGFASSGSIFAWIGPSWSISVEIFVNLIWVWLLTKTKNSIHFLWIILLAIFVYTNASPSLNDHHDAYGLLNLGLVRGLMDYFIGVLCYRHLVPMLPLVPAWCANLLAFPVVAISIFVFVKGSQNLLPGIDFVMVLLVFPSLILLSMHTKTFLHSFFRLKPILWLGSISYSIYLLHMLLGTFIVSSNGYLIRHWGMPAIAVLYWGLLFTFASIAYYFIETPCRRWINENWKTKQWALPRHE